MSVKTGECAVYVKCASLSSHAGEQHQPATSAVYYR